MPCTHEKDGEREETPPCISRSPQSCMEGGAKMQTGHKGQDAPSNSMNAQARLGEWAHEGQIGQRRNQTHQYLSEFAAHFKCNPPLFLLLGRNCNDACSARWVVLRLSSRGTQRWRGIGNTPPCKILNQILHRETRKVHRGLHKDDA